MPASSGASLRPLSRALLARDERHLLSPEDGRRFRGQRVLITGAAGSLGGALARHIARQHPAQLALLDLADAALVRLELTLLERHPALALDVVVGDVTRASDVRHAMRTARPDVVFHLAGTSEVSAAERAVCTAVRTNVFGALHVAREASLAGARLVVGSGPDADAVGTVLAATRRLAELVSLCPAASGFRPLIVRIDEVLDGSNGVVPTMLARLCAGRPLLVPTAHARVPLITMAEAVALLVKADAVGRRCDMFRLDTGEPMLLVDVAERLLRWAGDAGLKRVPVRIASETRGGAAGPEEDTFSASPSPSLRVRRERTPDTSAMSRILRAMRHDLRRRDALAVLASLSAAVPPYRPSRTAREVAAVSTLYAISPAIVRPSPPLCA